MRKYDKFHQGDNKEYLRTPIPLAMAFQITHKSDACLKSYILVGQIYLILVLVKLINVVVL